METQIPLMTKVKQGLRLGRACRLVWRCAPGLTLLSMVFLFIQGLLPLLSLYLTKLVVDAVAGGVTASDKLAAFKHAAVMVGLAGVVALVTGLIRTIAGIVNDAQTQVVSNHMYDVIHAKSVEVDLEYYENAQYYDALHRAQQEAPYRPTRIVNDLAQLVQSTVSLLAIAGLLCTVHWGVTVVLLAVSGPGMLVRSLFARTMYRWQRDRTATERRAWYYSWVITGQQYAKEIRLYGLGPLFTRRFHELRDRLYREKFPFLYEDKK